MYCLPENIGSINVYKWDYQVASSIAHTTKLGGDSKYSSN